MKKIIICVMAAFLSLTFFPLQSKGATTEPVPLAAPKPAESAEVRTMELRLNEIKAMDKSVMKPSEKKALRKEVKSINHKFRDMNSTVYVSATVIIIVVILLVVLL
jgi:hypothetical protein